jgi:gliding motility-associated-like protein
MCRVNFPSTFSPGSNGETTSFSPKVLNATASLHFNMIISNNKGEVVYEAYCVQDGWDGTYMGKPCPVGEYQYSASILESDKDPSQQFVKQGNVKLIR